MTEHQMGRYGVADLLRTQVPDVAEHMTRVAARIDTFMDQMYPAAPGGDADPELLADPAAWSALSPAAKQQTGADLGQALVAPVRHLLQAGGQRWRTTLILQVIEALGGEEGAFGPLVGAAELTHTGSLMVDDVEDDAPTRRGRPAVHQVFGAPVALNAGTLAYFAFDRAVQSTLAHDPHLQAEIYGVYLAALRAAHAGQALDIQGHHREMHSALATGSPTQLLERVLLTHRLKSGVMQGGWLQIAAMVSGAPEPVHQALARFGTAVGTAYQICDDIADLRGVIRAGQATKQAGEDLRNAKVTMPLAYAVQLLPAHLMRPMWHTIHTGQVDTAFIAETIQRFEECGALNTCATRATTLLDDAWEELHPLLPAGPATDLLYAMAHHLIHRNLAR
ncbi:polyprenyl synthetase family protein [Streptomyces sp. NPDC019937]|uniref:polyprenyl synthetase family protein n=1 Tax=Streptomyces sp. NPDC019937 TaxID=3154787 RepID=UPI00340F52D9